MLFNKKSKKNKKYLLYNTVQHKFNTKYNKIFKNTIHDLIKNPRYETDNFNKLYIIKK